jgi:hypothetical protein
MPTNYLTRLEPRPRSAGLETGVSARVYDPLWMLGRQWQFGELRGEDAGTPVGIELTAESAPVTQWKAASARGFSAYDVDTSPLEALVEAQPLRAPVWTARMRVDAGREFVQLLREAGLAGYLPAYLDECAVDPPDAQLRAVDESGARLVAVASGRVPDGEQLYRGLRAAIAQGQLPARPTIDPGDSGPVTRVARQWLADCAANLSESDGDSWDPERLEYGFSLATSAAADATRLDANEYLGGRLDWHSFDIRSPAAPAAFTAMPAVNVLPTGIRFRGMPNARWWEFEDASVDMGSVDAGASDAARLALLEFALLYGNDFYAVPLRLSVGTLTRVTSLVVADTFGMRLVVDAATRGMQRVGASRWTMFTLSQVQRGTGAGAPADVLFLPPNVGSSIASELVEDVLLLRDEMANLAWAIERSCEGESGIARDRAEANIRAIPVANSPPDSPELRYRLGTSVPGNWFPLVPVTQNGELRLELKRMADQINNPQAVPRGTFLRLPAPKLHEEEVPREGARLSRDYVMARWMNGSTVVWSRRRKRVGRGEGSSGLRFDVAEIQEAAEPALIP